MDGRYVVAEGTGDAQVSWVVWARRDAPRDGDFWFIPSDLANAVTAGR